MPSWRQYQQTALRTPQNIVDASEFNNRLNPSRFPSSLVTAASRRGLVHCGSDWEELKPSSYDKDLLRLDLEFREHVNALGLETIEQYVSWCKQHGFSQRVEKNWKQRCKERFFADRVSIRNRVKSRKNHKRRPAELIDRIFDRVAEPDLLSIPKLAFVHRLCGQEMSLERRQAFRHLIQKANADCCLLSTKPAISSLGTQSGNTFIEALFRISRHHENWLRPLESWKPSSKNAYRQFHSLVRHLLAEYPVPQFMDTVWFHDYSSEQDQHQRERWFCQLATGTSPRHLDLPVRLSKRMVGPFLNAIEVASVEEAIRQAQVITAGGGLRLAREIISSRIGTDFQHNDFWETVIRWFARATMFAPDQVAPLIDYLHRRRFEPETLGEPDGFTMKGRTPMSLLRGMQEWHARLRSQPQRTLVDWPTSVICGFTHQQGQLVDRTLERWSIVELTDSTQLHKEGAAMRHCVASYASMCEKGTTTIWSLGVERNESRRRIRVLTIQVNPKTKNIKQIRGKKNRLPDERDLKIIRMWAEQMELTL